MLIRQESRRGPACRKGSAHLEGIDLNLRSSATLRWHEREMKARPFLRGGDLRARDLLMRRKDDVVAFVQ
jgi:hypothetical protein